MLPSRFMMLRSARVIALWKVAEALHMPKAKRLHSNNPNSQAKAVFGGQLSEPEYAKMSKLNLC